MATLRRADSERSDSSVESQGSRSGFSTSTRSTAPSEYDGLRPTVSRGETWPLTAYKHAEYEYDGLSFEEPRQDDFDIDERSEVDEGEEEPEFWGTDAVPASEEEFKHLFPSIRQRLDIRHDDATSDGNMNIRVDTLRPTSRGKDQKVTLFHLRMYDLKTREFSLRRYCRDSQREVCTTSRKTKRQEQASRPAFARSISNLMTKSFSSKADLKKSKPARPSLARTLSGGIDRGDSDDEDFDKDTSNKKPPTIADLSDSMTIKFQDYSKLTLDRRGHGSHTHFDYEYWGERYTWQRLYRSDFDLGFTTYHLVRRSDGKALAHITPKQDTEAQRDREAGGWIPPSNFWLLDEKMTIAEADKVVATGLLAMVDDTIRTVYYTKEARPTTPSYFSPKRILSTTFLHAARPQTAQ